MNNNKVGKIIGVSDLNVKILLGNEPIKISDILFYKDEQDKMHRFEVVEMDSNIARAIPFENVQGVKKGIEFAILTDEITKAWSGMTTRRYKNLKGLTKENLRDNMTTTEIILNMLAETATKEISKHRCLDFLV